MKNFGVILLLAVTLFMVNCRGSKEENLIGTWKQIPFVDPTTVSSFEFWVFYNGDLLEIKDSVIGVELLKTDSYTYNLDGNKLRIFGDGVYLPAAGDPRGEYWIDQLNNDYLKMTKRKHPDGSASGAFMRIELVRQSSF